MKNESQVSVKGINKLSVRLSGYRTVFVQMAYRTGLTIEEVAAIFGTTKQNISLIIKKK